MDTLQEKGVFSKHNVEPLKAMLIEIGRVDLADSFVETYDEKTNSALSSQVTSPVDSTDENSPCHAGECFHLFHVIYNKSWFNILNITVHKIISSVYCLH